MNQKKRVFCLYRESKLYYRDDGTEANDIPMQRNACHGFIASHPSWVFYDERAEKGVSGFKISAKNRDAIQEIQQEALDHKFDVLLVYMFDRLGRKDDETPFIVEWFVQQGIEVWSVSEREQRFDTHVDKLTNYIRYWQASGESIKTSMRVAEGMGMTVQSGHFRGGLAPYGYQLTKDGRTNKKGTEVCDIHVDVEEAKVVSKIFDLYISQGYGTQRIATYLAEQGITNRKGNNFTNVTIRHMLKNRTYTGVLKSGKSESEILMHLQIITPSIFEAVQQLMEMRSKPKEERTVPLRIAGSALLAGNGYCGHCGARLTLTTSGKKRVNKDGKGTVIPRVRYVCYNKTRHKHLCDGQTGYTASKLDKIMDTIIHKLFARLTNLPKDAIIKQKCAEQIV